MTVQQTNDRQHEFEKEVLGRQLNHNNSIRHMEGTADGMETRLYQALISQT